MHIFISYAKADTRDLAIQLRDAMVVIPHITAWMDTSLYSGEDWATQIQDEIDRADLVVVLLSQDVNRPANHPSGRSFVLKEIHYAQQVKKTIIPVMAQSTRVPVQLAGIQYIDFMHDQSVGLQRLIREIATRADIDVPSSLIFDLFPPAVQPDNKFVAYRRHLILASLIALIAIVLITTILPALDRSPSAKPTDSISLLPLSVPTSAAAISSSPTTSKSNVPTSTTTASPTPTPSSTSTPTDEPTSTATFVRLNIPDTPILHNIDWASQHRDFMGFTMMLVPAGCFMMGSDEGNTSEQPINKQCFAKPFWIDQTEVTNSQFGSEGFFKGENRPRDSVTWFQAGEFCAKRGARLPTEPEWEYVARGPDNLIYPWGNDFVPDNLVYTNNANNQTAIVGSRPSGKSWVGAVDVSGNLLEWVSTIFDQKRFPYPYSISDGRESIADVTTSRGLRGGSWLKDPFYARTSERIKYEPYKRYYDVGFRCLREFDETEI